MRFYITIIIFVSAAVTFGFGVSRFFSKKTALFKILITSSIGCFMLEKCYELVNLFSSGEIPEGFNVGILGTIGGFLFIFSASCSQMDGLVDDHSKKLFKYRVISLLAPLIIMAFSIPFLAGDYALSFKIAVIAVYIFIAIASYFNLKHLIIPDVSCGIIDSIRGYSFTALILELLTAFQILSDKLNLEVMWIISSVLIAIAYPCMLLAMMKGSKKWTV